MKRLGLFVLSAALLAVLAFVASLLVPQPVPPWFSAVSAANGYDALVRAALKMKGSPPDEKGDATAFVQENSAMLKDVRSSLKLPFEVPLVQYSETNGMLKDLAGFKAIALALRAQGREAEQREAYAEAVGTYAEVIELGQRVEHGPLIALLTGVAIEHIGLVAIEKVQARLTPAQRKEVADRIELLNKERLPLSEVDLRERFFMRRTAGNPVALLAGRIHLRAAMKAREQRAQQLSSDFERVAQALRKEGHN